MEYDSNLIRHIGRNAASYLIRNFPEDQWTDDLTTILASIGLIPTPKSKYIWVHSGRRDSLNHIIRTEESTRCGLRICTQWTDGKELAKNCKHCISTLPDELKDA